jgi:hypothetical protein
VISPLQLQTRIPKKNPVQSPSGFCGANSRHLATKKIEFFILKKCVFDPKKKAAKHFEKITKLLKPQNWIELLKLNY